MSNWRVIGKSIRGESHLRNGLPNQDAICWLPESGCGLPLVLAVSDGHGNAKSFRSDVGARLAVQIAVEEISSFADRYCSPLNPSAAKRSAEEQLPKILTREWELAVKKHIEEQPFSSEELELLATKGGISAREAVEKNNLIAYGATLLAVLITETFIVYVQLGDGDILVVSDTGETYRPIPKDERLFANETTSLCIKNAWRDFYVRFHLISGSVPSIILAATDGYANSFRDEEEFLKVGRDFLDIIRSDTIHTVETNLENWLVETSRAGSGDDITVGIICREDTKENIGEPATM